MSKKKLSFFIVFLLAFSSLQLRAGMTFDIKLRFYGGIRSVAVELPRYVNTSYLQHFISASIKSKLDLEEEKKQIKRVFNLLDVNLITEADLRWEADDLGRKTHMVRLDGKEFLVAITRLFYIRKRQFRIEILEHKMEKEVSLLDTEFILPKAESAVFGFEDIQGNPYFLSVHVMEEARLEDVDKDTAKKTREMEEFAKGAVKAVGRIKPPRLIKEVKPIYPEKARELGAQGIVILNARTDEYGNIVDVYVIKRVHPLLDKAAVDAVRQWKYEQVFIKGEPRSVVFTITVTFKIK